MNHAILELYILFSYGISFTQILFYYGSFSDNIFIMSFIGGIIDVWGCKELDTIGD